jgi:sulfur-carrier protein
VSHVRVSLPPHLERLSGVSGEVVLPVGPEPTLAEVLDALETEHPVLEGTIREHGAGPRRAYIRFFASGRDLSHEPPGTLLPDEVVEGREALKVVGAIAGG